MYTSITFTINVEKGSDMDFNRMLEITKDAADSMERSCAKRRGASGCSDFYKVVWSNSVFWTHIEVLQHGEMTHAQSRGLVRSMSQILNHLSRRLGIKMSITNKSWLAFNDAAVKYVI